MSTEVQFVLVGGTVAGRRRGGAGAQVVLLHGLSSNSAAWEPVMRSLPRALDVIAIDLPGHGRSTASTDYSYDSLAAHICALLADAAFRAPVLVGHSWGGRVALAAAQRSLVGGVITVEGSANDAPLIDDPEPGWRRRIQSDPFLTFAGSAADLAVRLTANPGRRHIEERAIWPDHGTLRRHPNADELPAMYGAAYDNRPPESSWSSVHGVRVQVFATQPANWLEAKQSLAERTADLGVRTEFVEGAHDLLTVAPLSVAECIARALRE